MAKRLRVAILLIVAFALTACQLPPRTAIEESYALSASVTERTTLGAAVSEQAERHPDRSGIHILADSQDAFAARIQLVRGAERSIDLQYYIWRLDSTGSMLTQELVKAAQRGVRVRLLLDDFETTGLDAQLNRLHQHPNIEVRLFNPFVMRSQKWLGFITDLDRANRRMHNKTFTVDNSVTIIGGRNIADPYFGATDDFLFSDLDVLAIGPVVNAVVTDFDDYWNSKSAYPIDLIHPADQPPTDSAPIEKIVQQHTSGDDAVNHQTVVDESQFFTRLVAGGLELTWAPTTMLSDDPSKGLGRAAEDEQLYPRLEDIILQSEQRLYLVTPYLIPTASGVEVLKELAAKGVDINILTNSLAATDLAIVYAGYIKWRRELLEAGIKLYELKLSDEQLASDEDAAGSFSLSAGSLHAKAAAIDGKLLFIGSFNFDPRSANLNTELGFIIASPELTQALEQAFENGVPEGAYRVMLDAEGKLTWVEQTRANPVHYSTDPETSWWQRTYVWFMSLLPIDYFL
ncbi:phospholipase D family protein [Pseudidiomarina halophila]|uniref:PLD phosphodiesterase domain-containing protein n=1 Tax=Pseudidiomarina halophila TaxID=1449799 RepID=A0A432XVR0_9GAMM|nr:phospholipase D family protein [Pseudidiomarina halophila]RUO52789.1 hypothetical protein CWI69_07025 [Pseudidiomarina halophila]